MKFMLRHKTTGLYYSGWQSWTASWVVATDFGGVDQAIQRANEERLEAAEIVVKRGEDLPDQVFPIPQKPRL